jgi:hypothetical protein
MFRPVHRLFPAALIAGAALLAAPVAARADFAIRFVDPVTNTVFQTVTDGGLGDLDPGANSIAFSGDVGGFRVRLTSSVTNTPGNVADATITLDTNTIRNLSMTTSSSIRIDASATGYTLPPSPANFDYGIGGSFAAVSEASDSITFQGWLTSGSTLFSTGGTTDGTLFANRGVAPGVSTFRMDSNTILASYATPFTLTAESLYSAGPNDANLNAGVGFNSRTAASNVLREGGPIIPSPSSAVLVVSGMPIVVVAVWLRLRQKQGPPVALA